MSSTIRLMALAATAGIAADRLYLELRKPSAEQFRSIRQQVNENVNPWLIEHEIPGGPKAEIGTLEHVGRVSGQVHLTPVHPTVRGDTIFIPAPMGVGSQWALNVLHAGGARLQLFETTYVLDRPTLIAVEKTGLYPALVAAPLDRIGWRYVRFHVLSSEPGTLVDRAPSPEPTLA